MLKHFRIFWFLSLTTSKLVDALKPKNPLEHSFERILFGRGGRIRTCDLLLPKQAR